MNKKSKETKSLIRLEDLIGSGQKAIKSATIVANILKNIIEKQKLYTVIKGRKYVNVEGWVTLGSMLGVFADVVRCDVEKEIKQIYLVKRKINDKEFTLKTYKPIETDEVLDVTEREVIRAKAEVQLKHLRSGEVLGRAVAYCSNEEQGKQDFDEFKIASMAQTRATGKAFRLLVSWVMSLAGYEPTPAEEMENNEENNNIKYGEGELKLINN